MNSCHIASLVVGSAIAQGCASVQSDTAARPFDSAPAHAWQAHDSVGTVVAQRPDASRIFELIGIDYCCGGETSLADAADAAGVSLTRLLSALAVVGSAGGDADSIDWRAASIDELIDHIVRTYHAELRAEFPRLQQLIAKVTDVHQQHHPELAQVQSTFLTLRAELEAHLALEEERAFPALQQLAAGQQPHDLSDLLHIMLDDHEDAGRALQKIHTLTRGYTPPPDACPSYREMLRSLDRFERQTFAHIHLENNILLPHARELLAKAGYAQPESPS